MYAEENVEEIMFCRKAEKEKGRSKKERKCGGWGGGWDGTCTPGGELRERRGSYTHGSPLTGREISWE